MQCPSGSKSPGRKRLHHLSEEKKLQDYNKHCCIENKKRTKRSGPRPHLLDFPVEPQLAQLPLEPRVPPVGQVVHVGGPVVQPVEDVRRVEDGAPRRLALALEPPEQVLPHQDVQAGGHLVQQQDLEGPHQPQEDLHAPPLPVRHLVHAPGGVDAQQLHELIAPFGVLVLHLAHHARHGDVRLQWALVACKSNSPHPPIHVQVSSVEVQASISERVQPQNLNSFIWFD
mmetsp:Transcript_1843/g.2882  ORF Transcript_1843/g.2882 Transcript_1843/m.2882 type:complete len:228 (-) Transcript_1843:372-1055(-)